MLRSLDIVRSVGLAFVEDGGRAGGLRWAVPRGGALDPEALAAANAVVGNAPGAAALERYGAIELRAGADLVIADESGTVTALEAGASARFAWDGERRARYLAIDGGIVVPAFLGGAGTIVGLGRGGHEGRALRAGDRLVLGVPSDRGERRALPPMSSTFPVVPGPDLDRLGADALDVLLATSWKLDVRSDRTGTRLVGPALPHAPGARAVTTPMVEGAIECPPGSAPIVLGPEHPTTGGYPVVAVLRAGALAAFHRVPLGREVRFVVTRGDGRDH
ncbi:MAG: hypothetical protein U0234_26320 [Sandaracinus sp.]